MSENEVTYRVKFTKGESVKYIGHLDVMRLFQRAIRRAGLPVAYSKGFNPHQLLGFASPLSLGMTATGEYGDFTMAEVVDPSILVSRLNATLPEGVTVLSAVRIKDKVLGAMAAVEAARYLVSFPMDTNREKIVAAVSAFLAQSEIVVMKKTKKNLKPTDIRPDIFEMTDVSDAEGVKLELFLAAGSNRNVKAELVMASLYEFMDTPFDWYAHDCCRQELYRLQGETFVPLNQGDVVEEF